MLAYSPVTLKLSDQPIYGIQALGLGPRQCVLAAAGEKLWVYVVTLADDDPPRNRRHRGSEQTRKSKVHAQLVVEWTPVDSGQPPTTPGVQSKDVDSARRSDTSGCPFHSGFLTPDPIAPSGDDPFQRRARHPASRHESLYTLCLLTLPAAYTGPLGSPGHIVCVTGGRAGYLHVFNVHLQAHVRVVRAGLGGDINDIVAYPWGGGTTGPWVVVACKDRTVRIVDLHRGVSLLVLGGIDGHQGQVLCVSVHPSGRWIASGGADCAVRVWRVPDGVGEGLVTRIDRCTWWTQWPHATFVDGVTFVGDEDELGGMTVVSKSVDGEAVVWRVDTRPADVAGSGRTVQEVGGTDVPTWARHSELNADVEERGRRPPILALLTYPPHNLWFFKLSFTFPYLALGTGTGAMAVWNLARTLHILRERTRAASKYAETLDWTDMDEPHVPAARTLASIVTPTADFLDRYSLAAGVDKGPGPVVWTRKAIGKDVAGELVRMCIAVPFEINDEKEEIADGSMNVDPDTSHRARVRFAEVPSSESDEDESEDEVEEEASGVLLLVAGVSESGKLILSVARDRAPIVTRNGEHGNVLNE